MFTKILSFFKTDVIKQVGDVVDKFVMTKEEKAKAKQAMTDLLHSHELQMQRFSLEAEQEFNQRIKDMEGTANDLNRSGFMGKIVLFFRGAQRPLWGFLVMYIDLMVFSSKWAIPDGSGKESAFWIINFLVLGFLFGERAVKNVAPLISQMIKKK